MYEFNVIMDMAGGWLLIVDVLSHPRGGGHLGLLAPLLLVTLAKVVSQLLSTWVDRLCRGRLHPSINSFRFMFLKKRNK